MNPNQMIFWLSASAGTIVAGWWLASRSQGSSRGNAVPMTALLLVLSVLVLLLSATGQDLQTFVAGVRLLLS